MDALQTLNLISSRSDAKRIIKSGGVKINDTKATLEKLSLKEFLKENNEIKIVVGKKKFGIIKVLK